MKDKPKSGLIINWLGRDAAQVLKLMDVETNSPNEVYEALEQVFRPESNQILARFKLRNMKQGMSQSCDVYMSQLRFALPECKYKHDGDELLKDQFIFSLLNKEIQDHLLGELSEMDNSVHALYEAHKVESKLEQRKLLEIVTPSAVGMDAIRQNRFSHEKCDFCGQNHKKGKQNCLAYGRICDRCYQKNHFKAMCRSSEGSRYKSKC